MKLVAFGDSFTQGLILDMENNFQENTFAHQQSINYITQLSKYFDDSLKIENYAAPGASNPQIASRVFDFVKRQECLEDTIILVSWTSPHRQFYYSTILNQGKDIMDDAVIIPEGGPYEMLQDHLIHGVYGLCAVRNIPLLMTNSFADFQKIEHADEYQDLKEKIKCDKIMNLNYFFDEEVYIEWSKPNNSLFDICCDLWLSGEDNLIDHLPRLKDIRKKISTIPEGLAPDLHPSPCGHKKIAKTLLPYLVKKINTGTMRAVKGKNGILSIINRDEAALYNNTDLAGFLDSDKLDERQHHIAEELHKKNILQKVRRGDRVGYKIFPQKTPI